MSYYLTGQRALAAADPALAARALAGCHEVLHRSITAGMTFDPPIVGLYAQLRQAPGDGK